MSDSKKTSSASPSFMHLNGSAAGGGSDSASATRRIAPQQQQQQRQQPRSPPRGPHPHHPYNPNHNAMLLNNPILSPLGMNPHSGVLAAHAAAAARSPVAALEHERQNFLLQQQQHHYQRQALLLQDNRHPSSLLMNPGTARSVHHPHHPHHLHQLNHLPGGTAAAQLPPHPLVASTPSATASLPTPPPGKRGGDYGGSTAANEKKRLALQHATANHADSRVAPTSAGAPGSVATAAMATKNGTNSVSSPHSSSIQGMKNASNTKQKTKIQSSGKEKTKSSAKTSVARATAAAPTTTTPARESDEFLAAVTAASLSANNNTAPGSTHSSDSDHDNTTNFAIVKKTPAKSRMDDTNCAVAKRSNGHLQQQQQQQQDFDTDHSDATSESETEEKKCSDVEQNKDLEMTNHTSSDESSDSETEEKKGSDDVEQNNNLGTDHRRESSSDSETDTDDYSDASSSLVMKGDYKPAAVEQNNSEADSDEESHPYIEHGASELLLSMKQLSSSKETRRKRMSKSRPTVNRYQPGYMNGGRWNDDEKAAFLKAYELYGEDFRKYVPLIKTRTARQISIYHANLQRCGALDNGVAGMSKGTDFDANDLSQDNASTNQALLESDDAASYTAPVKRRVRQNSGSVRLRPSYFTERDPTSIVEACNEWLGIREFEDQPMKGGFGPYFGKNAGKYISGEKYPRYRVVRDVSRLVLKMTDGEENQDERVQEELQKLDKQQKESGKTFWIYYHDLTGKKGNTPVPAEKGKITSNKVRNRQPKINKIMPKPKPKPMRRVPSKRPRASAACTENGKCRPQPSFFNDEPVSIVDACNEWLGLEKFENVPVPGGFEVYYKGRTQSLSGIVYPKYRIIRDVSRMVLDIAEGEEYGEARDKRLQEELHRLDEQREAEGTTFWEHYFILTGSKGRKPDEIVDIRKSGLIPKRKFDEFDQFDLSDPSDGRRLRRRSSLKGQENTSLKGQENTKKIVKLLLEKDPNDVFVEETSFLFHDPPAKQNPYEEEVDSLVPLPPAPPLPGLPKDSSVVWKFDEVTRVLLADFNGTEDISDSDKRFFCTMMQRDDIALVSEGLMRFDKPEHWTLDFVEEEFQNHYFHKFRLFQRQVDENGAITYAELDGFASMRLSDFTKYLKLREVALEMDFSENTLPSFNYTNKDGKEIFIDDVRELVIYMVDAEMSTNLPELDADFKSGFRMKEILPGGEWCMMRPMPQTARPFMGPNLYVTPGGGFTHMHQDGHGTVDSGHYVVAGYNEVVMLRRMPERHKQNACKLIPRKIGSGNNKEYDPLYSLPHGDKIEQGKRPDWPHISTVDKWNAMNYYPCVLILKPGQHVHIGKGREHMFRKTTAEPLPEHDCHAMLRRELVESNNLEKSPLCVSVAFDWIFRGYDAEGINREVSSIVECAALCRNNMKQSLATPEAAILSIATRLSLKKPVQEVTSFLGQATLMNTKEPITSDQDLCKGILPSLKHIVERERLAYDSSGTLQSVIDFTESGTGLEIQTKLTIADMNKNPLECFEDPRGDDYYCKLCHSELSNIYYHCDGCENLLDKDFNICSKCYIEKSFKTLFKMHRWKISRVSTINHTGSMPERRGGAKCPCHRGRTCTECKLCTGCSCDCHTKFTAHFRKMTPVHLDELLAKIEELAGSNPLPYEKETAVRLKVAVDRNGEGRREKMKLLADYPRNALQKAAIDEEVATGPCMVVHRNKSLSSFNANMLKVDLTSGNSDSQDVSTLPIYHETQDGASDKARTTGDKVHVDSSDDTNYDTAPEEEDGVEKEKEAIEEEVEVGANGVEDKQTKGNVCSADLPSRVQCVEIGERDSAGLIHISAYEVATIATTTK